MSLPKPSVPKDGFSLIEMVMVLGILALILAIGLPVSVDFYLSYQFSSEARLLTSLLSQARNLAMVNYNENSHGVYVGADDFILFEGSNYTNRVASQDRLYPRAAMVAIGGPDEFVFAALSGRTSSSTVVLSDEKRSRIININEEGAITY